MRPQAPPAPTLPAPGNASRPRSTGPQERAGSTWSCRGSSSASRRAAATGSPGCSRWRTAPRAAGPRRRPSSQTPSPRGARAGSSRRGSGSPRGGWTSYARDCFAEASRGFDRALQRSDARAAWSRKAECDALLGDGVPRPAAGSARLTPREREVVAFAAAGLSDREIAERLTVSVRTIEGHLYRAYAKLEVTSREQLGAAFGSGGATPAAPGGSEYTRAASK
ncbi:response regulator transcription factor [Sinomonas atrocyanea]|uniref:response regulator transcription factor n=1 Tax=Sinomonas atrocyanea TaxID=37927 RepID=UPI00358F1739